MRSEMRHDPTRWAFKILYYHPLNYDYRKYFVDTFDYVQRILKYSNKGDKILEIGGGNGLVAIGLKLIAKRKVTYSDINPAVVKLAKKRFKYWNVDIPSYIIDGFNIPFKSKEFKVCYSEGLHEHFNDAEIIKLTLEMSRVAEYVVIYVPTADNVRLGGGYGDERLITNYGWHYIFSKTKLDIIEEFGNNYFYGVVLK